MYVQKVYIPEQSSSLCLSAGGSVQESYSSAPPNGAREKGININSRDVFVYLFCCFVLFLLSLLYLRFTVPVVHVNMFLKFNDGHI